MSQPILLVKDLTKSYGDYLAVDHISFEIEEGKILGLLGPNGAGKSTTIQMLLGLTEKDSGSISYFGKDFDAEKEYCLSKMNFASTYAEMNGRMTVYQNLRIYAGLYNIPDANHRIHELLELLEVAECTKKNFWHLSSGQKTRVIIARSLLNRPKMLLMDEPTASLDPDIVNKIIQVIKDMQEKEKVSILYTSHNMEEVARLCDKVAFLAHGKIVAIDTPLELTKKVGSIKLVLTFEGRKEALTSYLDKGHHPYVFIRANLIEITASEKDIPKILFGLNEKGVDITSITTQSPSLEDVFLHISQGNQI
jgi:ABC-2 type transport system ATP-binding protein